MTHTPRSTPRRLAASLAVGAALAGVAATGIALAAPSPAPSPTPSVSTATSSSLADTIAFMSEEERMARDLYAALAEAHDGATPMSRITLSEQRHVDAVGRLLTTYGIADPGTGLAPGSYAYPELNTLYTTLYAQGVASLDGAYAAGVAVEKADIADLRQAIDDSDDPTVDRVFTGLLQASEQHLRAFEAAGNGTSAGRATTTDADRSVGWAGGNARRGPQGAPGACLNG